MAVINRKRGDTYADELLITSKSTKLPIDITGYTFIMTLDPEKAPLNSDNNLYSLTGVIIDAAGGRVGFSPSDIQADQVGSFFYDVQMIDGDGRVRTIALDKYVYTQDITK